MNKKIIECTKCKQSDCIKNNHFLNLDSVKYFKIESSLTINIVP